VPRRKCLTALIAAALVNAGLAAASGVVFAAAPVLDPTFGTGGVVTLAPGPNASFGAVLPLSGGKVLVGGRANTKDFVLARYLANGTLDPSFGSGGVTTQQIGTGGGGVSNLALQGDRILAVGATFDAALDPVSTLARFTYDGALDTTFAGGTGYIQESSAIARDGTDVAVQPDDRIVVAASSAGADGGTLVLRYDKDGGLDPTFDGDGAARTANAGACGTDAQSGANTIVPTGAGLIVGALCGGRNGTLQRAAVLRFHAGTTPSNGALDTTFGSGGVSTLILTPGTPTFATGMVVQPDGKIIQAMQDGYGGTTSGLAAARWNADGTLDTTFGAGGRSARFGFVDGIGSSESFPALAPDGRIYLGGTIAPQTGGVGIARLSSSGALDALWGTDGSFVQPFGEPAGPMDVSSEPLRLAVQPDGRVLAAGFARQSGERVGLLMRFIPPPEPTPPASPVPSTAPPPAGAVKAKLRFADLVALPSAKRCVSRRAFRIRLRKRSGVTYRSATVSVNGRRVKVVKGRRLTAPVDLRGLPTGRVVVRISVTLADGTRLTGKRSYRTCTPKKTRGRR